MLGLTKFESGRCSGANLKLFIELPRIGRDDFSLKLLCYTNGNIGFANCCRSDNNNY